MSRGRITIVNYEYDDLTMEREACAEQGYEFTAGHCETEEELLELVGESDGIMNIYARITPEVAGKLKNCKVIARTGVGYDMIDVVACRANGIEVCYVPDYCVNEVADHALGLMIALQRKIYQHHQNIQQGIWDYQLVGPVARLNRQTLGLIGLGRIGLRFAAKVREVIPNILVYDPYVADDVLAGASLTRASLETIFDQAHIISLHTPLTDDTRYMINAESIATMKQQPFLVNVSRGALIDTDALVAALHAGQIRGAALDVLETEPEIPQKLIGLENVILTPHAAWYSQDAEIETRTRALADIFRVLNGEAPRDPAP